MTNILKECPFCGKSPHLDKGYSGYAVLHSCDFIKSTIGRMKKDKVIEMWNTRVDVDNSGCDSNEIITKQQRGRLDPLGISGPGIAENKSPDKARTSKFKNVSCSSCGEDFGPGDSGFSHCESHEGMREV